MGQRMAPPPALNGAVSTDQEKQMFSVASELVRYMSARKKWWLFPIIAMLVLIGMAAVTIRSRN